MAIRLFVGLVVCLPRRPAAISEVERCFSEWRWRGPGRSSPRLPSVDFSQVPGTAGVGKTNRVAWHGLKEDGSPGQQQPSQRDRTPTVVRRRPGISTTRSALPPAARLNSPGADQLGEHRPV